jgi:uncharacterized protein YdaU (DUF1376 family)
VSVLPYHKRYHSDALAGFMSLTLEERGAYQTLLDMIYDRGGPLIDNERLLAGYMNCSVRKWRQLREDLIGKGKIRINSDGQITNRRAQKEIENQSKTSRKLIEAGAKGGRTRAEKEKLSNENSGGEQAGLKAGSSDPQAIPEARSQKLERREESNLPPDVRAIMSEGGFVSPPPDAALLREWYAAGADLNHHIIPIVRAVRARLSKAPFKLKVFDAAIREKLAEDETERERHRTMARRYEAIEEQERAAAAGRG